MKAHTKSSCEMSCLLSVKNDLKFPLLLYYNSFPRHTIKIICDARH